MVKTTSARPGGGVRRRARAASEHAQGHEHLRAQPHVGPGERPGVRRPRALGAREAQERRRAHRQEGPPQGGQGRGRRRRRSRPSRPSAAAPPPKWRRSRPRPRRRRKPRWRRSSSSVPSSSSRSRSPTQSLEERARALFKDLPPAPAETEDGGRRARRGRRAGAPVASAAPAEPLPPRLGTHSASGAPSQGAVHSARASSVPPPRGAARSQAGVQQQRARPRPRVRARRRVPAAGPSAATRRRPGSSAPTPKRAAAGRRARRASARRSTRMRCRRTSSRPCRA